MSYWELSQAEGPERWTFIFHERDRFKAASRIPGQTVLVEVPKPLCEHGVIKVPKPIRSTITKVDDTLVLNCTFQTRIPEQYYVTWVIGGYRVEHSDTKFKLFFKDCDTYLIIYGVDYVMNFGATCELHYQKNTELSVLLTKTKARFCVSPLMRTDTPRISRVLDMSKVYTFVVKPLKLTEIKKNPNRFLDIEVNFCLLKNNKFFVRTIRNDSARYFVKVICCDHRIDPYAPTQGQDRLNNKITMILKWVIVNKFGQPINVNIPSHYTTVRCFSTGHSETFANSGPYFAIVDPPIEDMLYIHIRAAMQTQCNKIVAMDFGPIKEQPQIERPSVTQLVHFFWHYKPLEAIGCGTFGRILSVRTPCGLLRAAKCTVCNAKTRYFEEYCFLRTLIGAPHVLQLIDVYTEGVAWVMVTELLSGGNLRERLLHEQTRTEADIKVYIIQLCKGLAHIHAEKIMHFDINLSNILCVHPNSNEIKIIDFGVARYLSKNNYYDAKNNHYDRVPPELAVQRYSLQYDMWSLGVILSNGLTGGLPSMNGCRDRQMKPVDFFRHLKISPLALDLLGKLLEPNSGIRLKAKDAVHHPWFTDTSDRPLYWDKKLSKLDDEPEMAPHVREFLSIKERLPMFPDSNLQMRYGDKRTLNVLTQGAGKRRCVSDDVSSFMETWALKSAVKLWHLLYPTRSGFFNVMPPPAHMFTVRCDYPSGSGTCKPKQYNGESSKDSKKQEKEEKEKKEKREEKEKKEKKEEKEKKEKSDKPK